MGAANVDFIALFFLKSSVFQRTRRLYIPISNKVASLMRDT